MSTIAVRKRPEDLYEIAEQSMKHIASLQNRLAKIISSSLYIPPFFEDSGYRKPFEVLYRPIQGSLVWDTVLQKPFVATIYERIALVFLNVLHYLMKGHKRYLTDASYIFSKILSSLDAQRSFRDRQFLDQAVIIKQNLIRSISPALESTEELIKIQIVEKIDQAFHNFQALNFEEKQAIYPGVPPHLLYDLDYVKRQLSQNGSLLRFLEPYQTDKDLITIAINQNPESFEFINKDLKADKEFLLKLIDINTKIYDFLKEPLKFDLDIIKKVVSKNGKKLSLLKLEFQLNPDLVLLALKSPSCDLACAYNFRNHKEIMLEAYRKGAPLKLIDESLKEDKDFVMQAIEIRGWDVYMRAAPFLKSDLEVKKCAYKKRFMRRKLFEDQIKSLKRELPCLFDDEEFMYFLIAQGGHNLKYGSKRIKSLPGCILKAVKDFPQILMELDPSFRAQKSFMIEAIKVKPSIIGYAAGDLLEDEQLAETAVGMDKYCMLLIGSQLQNDPRFIKKMVMKYPATASLAKFNRLELEDTLEILSSYGHMYRHLPSHLKASSACIKAACLSYPAIIYQIDETLLQAKPELSRLYLLSKLEKSSTTLHSDIYLPKSFCEKYQTHTATEVDMIHEWGDLFKDLRSFIESWNKARDLKLLNFSPSMNHLDEASLSALKDQYLQDKKALYLANLERAYERIEKKLPFLGTPKADDLEGLDLFYATIQYHMKRISHVLIQDKDMRRERMQILDAFLVCGGGLLGQLHELDLQFFKHQQDSLEDTLAAKLKTMALAKISRMNPTGDVHTANTLKWHLADFIGGQKIILDHLADSLDQTRVMISFLKMYSPKSIALEMIADLQNDESLRDKLSLYIQETFIPEFAKSKKLIKILEEKKLSFISLLEHFETHKVNLIKQQNLLRTLSFDMSLQAQEMLYRAGNPDMIERILKLSLLSSVPKIEADAFITSKESFKDSFHYLTDLSMTLCLPKKELLSLTREDIAELLTNPTESFLNKQAFIAFETLYKDSAQFLNPHGMCEILTALGFFEKLSQ